MYTHGAPSAGPGMSNPLTVQSSVVLNGRYDRYFSTYRKNIGKTSRKTLGGTAEDQNFDVMPRELAMMLRQDFDSAITRPMNYERDREIRIFTSANQLPCLDDDAMVGLTHASLQANRQLRAQLREQFVFVGVPQTKVLHGNQNQPDAVAVQVSGSTSIFNTGIYEIHAFDLVCWDIPYCATASDAASGVRGTIAPTPPGLPGTKMPFWTVPMRMAARDDSHLGADQSISHCATEDIFSAIDGAASSTAGRTAQPRKKLRRSQNTPTWDLLRAAVERTIQTPGTSKAVKDEALKSLLNYWTNAQLRYSHRVIGVALSKGRPGEQFDILLQKSY